MLLRLQAHQDQQQQRQLNFLAGSSGEGYLLIKELLEYRVELASNRLLQSSTFRLDVARKDEPLGRPFPGSVKVIA